MYETSVVAADDLYLAAVLRLDGQGDAREALTDTPPRFHSQVIIGGSDREGAAVLDAVLSLPALGRTPFFIPRFFLAATVSAGLHCGLVAARLWTQDDIAFEAYAAPTVLSRLSPL